MLKKEFKIMPKIDKEIIQRKIKSLQDDLVELKNYKDMGLEDYLKNREAQLIVERLLEKVTSRLIDINYHILKEEYEVMPEDYYTSFIDMGKNKVITEEFAKEIAKAAGLRNALAHEYDDIDQKQIYEAITSALTQIPQYLQAVLRFIS